MSAKTPSHSTWMPFYPGAYLRQTGRLTTAQHGAYLLLLLEAWAHDGLIPDDDDELAQITRMSAREWRANKDKVLRYWTASEGGYRQARLDEELARAKRLVAVKSDAGKASAEARKRQRKDNSRSTPVGTEPPTAVQQTGRPSPSPDSEDKSSGADAPFDPEKKAWDDGAQLLVSVGKMSPPNARAFLGKLKSEHGITMRDLLPAIGTAIANGTQDPAAYLRRAAAGVSTRKAGGSAAPPSADEPINWTIRADAWKRDGTWLGAWGPTPREKGCQCPKGLLEVKG